MRLYAALPFVELANEKTISLGPVLFWPVSRFPTFLPLDQHDSFRAYLSNSPPINTCISIDESIPLEQQESLVLDAINLLYFTCSFRDIYYFTNNPSFELLRIVIPFSTDLSNQPLTITALVFSEHDLICLSCLETEVLEGLGKALTSAYSNNIETTENSAFSRRLINSIRYFNNCFFPRILNYHTKQELFPKLLFEPEDSIMLAASFKALFDLSENNTTADLKHKMRPLLHLKYANSLELFWKWTDHFYAILQQTTRGETHQTSFFTLNPNFSVSHGIIGFQLLIYSIYYHLFTHNFIKAEEEITDFPPDFKWIHPENLLIFFWTEIELLQKINLLISQVEAQPEKIDSKNEIHFLVKLFMALQTHYHRHPNEEILFFKTPVIEILKNIEPILNSAKNPLIRDLLPNDFYYSLLQKKSDC